MDDDVRFKILGQVLVVGLGVNVSISVEDGCCLREISCKIESRGQD